MASHHLAAEWRSGLDADRLFLRAGVLAPANDLLVATALVAPEVVGARRALMRLLGRPVGQSGSGPTCWVLYPSVADAAAAATRVNEALESGQLRLPGQAPAAVSATTILPGSVPSAIDPDQPTIPPGGLVSVARRSTTE